MHEKEGVIYDGHEMRILSRLFADSLTFFGIGKDAQRFF